MLTENGAGIKAGNLTISCRAVKCQPQILLIYLVETLPNSKLARGYFRYVWTAVY